MIHVRFCDSAEDSLLKFAVIVSKHNGKWVFCKHKQRQTYECPGGHREKDERIDDTAQREPWEETGAAQFDIRSVCVYSVEKDGEETFGMLYAADIFAFGPLPAMEIEKVELFENLPDQWTYPQIQPLLLQKAWLEEA